MIGMIHRRSKGAGTMRRAIALVVLIPFALAVGCSNSSVPSSASASLSSVPSSASAFHRSHLAEGESEALAAVHVDVPAYGGYADVARNEVQHASSLLDEAFISAFSLHTVIGLDGEEIAFLQLYELSSAVPSDASDAEVLRAFVGEEIAFAATLSHQEVYLLEDPSDPDSRYRYAWKRGNVLAAADSGGREELLGWVRAYLTALSQA
jgi:hypothetical protein